MRSQLVRLSVPAVLAMVACSIGVASAQAASAPSTQGRFPTPSSAVFENAVLAPGGFAPFTSSAVYTGTVPIQGARNDVPPLAWRVATVATFDMEGPASPYREPAPGATALLTPATAPSHTPGWPGVFATLMLVAFFLFRRSA